MRTIVLSLACLLVLSVTAHADRNAAREHFRKGTVFFNLQKYAEAAQEYEAAYESHEDPLILFNIAQAYRLAGDANKALGAYRSYLRNTPNAANRADVQMRIDELQKIVEVQKRNREAPPMGTLGNAPEPDGNGHEPEPKHNEPTPNPNVTPQPTTPQVDVVAERKKARTMTNAGIALAAGGAAFIVVGGALAGVGASNADRLNNAPAGTVFDPSAESSAKTMGPAGVALAVVGGVAAVTGVALIVVGKKKQRSLNASLLPAVSPTSASLALSGQF